MRKSCKAIVQLPYTSPPIPFGPPIRVGSVRDTSFTYLRILFQHKKQKKIIVFTKNSENQGRSLSSSDPSGGFYVVLVAPNVLEHISSIPENAFSANNFFCNFWFKFGPFGGGGGGGVYVVLVAPNVLEHISSIPENAFSANNFFLQFLI